MMTDAEVVLPRPVSYLTPMTLDLDFYVPFSPWLWCQGYAVKARGRCLHHGFGAKDTR